MAPLYCIYHLIDKDHIRRWLVLRSALSYKSNYVGCKQPRLTYAAADHEQMCCV